MIAYICNKCNKPIDMDKEYCTHLKISWGKEAIRSMGKYGDTYDADLCEECYKKISPQIDKYYYGGNKYLEHDNTTDCGNWRRIKDELPPADGSYIVSTKKGSVCTARFYAGHGKFSSRLNESIIAWQPLPRPYKEVVKVDS